MTRGAGNWIGRSRGRVARQQEDDAVKLKRERAGRYVTADGRFAVEGGAAGAWYAIDSQRQDDLGLPLVRGPYSTLDVAREAVAEALRTSDQGAPLGGPPARPVAPPRKSTKARPLRDLAPAGAPIPHTVSSAKRAAEKDLEPARERPRLRSVGGQAPPEAEDASAIPKPDEGPAWLARLQPDQRSAARRLLSLLERAGIDDPALVRREIEAELPDVARALLARSVQREALDGWRAGAKALEDLTGEAAMAGATTAGSGRSGRQTSSRADPRTRAARAAVRRLLSRADPDDLALLAWLVALRTSVRIFDALGGEGRDAGQGLRGWRLVELGAGRAPTGRALAIDEPDLLGE